MPSIMDFKFGHTRARHRRWFGYKRGTAANMRRICIKRFFGKKVRVSWFHYVSNIHDHRVKVFRDLRDLDPFANRTDFIDFSESAQNNGR